MKTNDHLYKILELGTALTTEKNPNKLLQMILKESREITNCDAGTLYIKDKETLKFKIIENDTLNIYKGMNGEEIDLPPVDINSMSVSAYVAREKIVLNIEDVYKDTNKLLDGAKKYDQITGYRSESMLVLPLMDYEDEVIGVMQLINARNHEGKVIPFLKYHEKMILYHGSQVAIYMSNINYLNEIHELFNSFVRVMVSAIDRKTKYNGNHTKNIVRILENFVEYINDSKNGCIAKHHFNEKRKKEILMSAWLHDIGKIDVPLEIMNKPTRLSSRLEVVEYKIKLEMSAVEIAKLKGTLELMEAESRIAFLGQSIELINKCNDANIFITDELLEHLEYVYEYKTIGENERLLTETEYEQLTIRRGSLSDEERKVMNSHVSITREMLEEVPFTEDLKHVKEWASMHHETLDGKGYPYGIAGEDIPFEARILTIIDIFEALTSRDRPYKEPMPVERAIKILQSMVDEGKLDAVLVAEFEKSKAWEEV